MEVHQDDLEELQRREPSSVLLLSIDMLLVAATSMAHRKKELQLTT